MTELELGMDFRRREYRREVFLRFYAWSLVHASFPGAVHYVLPHLATALELDAEQRAWLAFLNANTQNPITTLLLFGAAPRAELAPQAVSFLNQHWADLQWDTDRRYHKSKFGAACDGYLQLTGGKQARYWQADDWTSFWQRANAIPFMGRLSAWSYLEYLRILRFPVPDADSLLLSDRTGSRSHRNGLALVTGHDDWIWWDYNPAFDGGYSPDMVNELELRGNELLYDVVAVLNDLHLSLGTPVTAHAAALDRVGRLSLESALCTYKSWHRPNRRYPGVYNDLLYDRIRHGEIKFGQQFGLLWDARRAALPSRLLLEDNPRDPGCVPVKQNWYREHGQVINMTTEWSCFQNDFESSVEAGSFGDRKIRWI